MVSKSKVILRERLIGKLKRVGFRASTAQNSWWIEMTDENPESYRVSISDAAIGEIHVRTKNEINLFELRGWTRINRVFSNIHTADDVKAAIESYMTIMEALKNE